MDHPLHMGIHMGPLSAQPIQRRVRSADLVLALGTELTDMNLGAAKPQVARDTSVWAIDGRVNVSFHQYTDVELYDFVAALAAQPLPRFRERIAYHDNLVEPRRRARAPEAAARERHAGRAEPLPRRARGLPRGRRVGRRAVRRARAAPPGGLYLAQGYYASMGFGVPAALGAQIGTGARPLVLTGDGAFQMTGAEISHAPRHGLTPIVVLMNNGGWGIFRPVSQRRDLLEIPNWPYAELAQNWGGVGFVAESAAELARGAARRARGEGLRADRMPHRARRPVADQPALHPREREEEQGRALLTRVLRSSSLDPAGGHDVDVSRHFDATKLRGSRES